MKVSQGRHRGVPLKKRKKISKYISRGETENQIEDPLKKNMEGSSDIERISLRDRRTKEGGRGGGEGRWKEKKRGPKKEGELKVCFTMGPFGGRQFFRRETREARGNKRAQR